MNTPKLILQNQVDNFKKWWNENYTPKEIKELRTDDPGYPDWYIIENYFAELLKNDLIKKLDKEEQINLLWLIARNWDIGRMIGWLYEKNPLSNLGNLTEEDFIMLSKTLVELDNPEFKDAKSQFASSFKKLKTLTPEIEKILLDYFNDNDEYTKRTSLYSLGKLGYSDLMILIQNSWEHINEEHYKIGCLQIINTYVKDKEIMKKYINYSDKIEGEYLKKFVDELRKNKNYL
jgi:hypothetical protein